MNQFLKIKLKGNVLNFSILFVLIISMLVSILVQQFYFSQKNKIRVKNQAKIISSIYSGLDYALYSKMIPYNENHTIHFTNNHDIEIKSKFWGVFHLVGSKYQHGKNEYKKVGIYANSMADLFDYQLYIRNSQNPISVIGASSINGNVMLPNKRIKNIFIEGRNNTSLDSIKGELRISQAILPPIDEALIINLKRLISGRAFNSDSVVDFSGQNELAQSFFAPTIIMQYNQSKMDNISYKGNIIIHSKNDLIIGSSSKLEEVIVIAPSITIEERFEGNAQFLAYKSIEVNQHVHLEYPSTLLVMNNKQESSLFLDSNSSVEGTILHLSNHASSTTSLSKKSLVNGLVYSLAQTELQSTINGTILIDRAYLITSSSKYQNVLMDVTINREPLIPDYATMTFNSELEKKLIKWLD